MEGQCREQPPLIVIDRHGKGDHAFHELLVILRIPPLADTFDLPLGRADPVGEGQIGLPLFGEQIDTAAAEVLLGPEMLEGAFADLALFDANDVRDAATYASPHAFPEGIRAVIVNGIVAWEEGNLDIARAGRALRRT